jgi:hypothetical protein
MSKASTVASAPSSPSPPTTTSCPATKAALSEPRAVGIGGSVSQRSASGSYFSTIAKLLVNQSSRPPIA